MVTVQNRRCLRLPNPQVCRTSHDFLADAVCQHHFDETLNCFDLCWRELQLLEHEAERLWLGRLDKRDDLAGFSDGQRRFFRGFALVRRLVSSEVEFQVEWAVALLTDKLGVSVVDRLARGHCFRDIAALQKRNQESRHEQSMLA